MEEKITLDDWVDLRKRILNLLKLDEKTVYEIWKDQQNTVDEIDLDHLVYRWDAPLWTKMIFRLRSCPEHGRGIFFWNQIDPGNRQRLCSHFRLETSKKTENLLNFLVWFFQNRTDEDLMKISDNMDAMNDLFNEYLKYCIGFDEIYR